MNFKEWIQWLNALPGSFKWFPVLIILRPVIDNLYFLKNISPYLSPPYIIGVLTPILCIYTILKYKIPPLKTVDKTMIYWSVSVVVACLMLVFYDVFSLLAIEFVLKLIMPICLYFFLRIFIRDLRDLHGILQCFLYAGIFVATLLLYEVFVNPIAIQESRGMERIQASFGDVVSYGVFITFALITASYFFFSRQHIVSKMRLLAILIPVVILSLLGLFNIHHTASYMVFATIFLTFIAFNLRVKNQSVALAIIAVAGLGFMIWGPQIISDQISPLVQTDLQVYSGEQDADKLLHGRVGRWRNMLENFSAEGMHVQFFGYPLKMQYVYHYIGSGSHNDFVRVLFTTGVVGFVLYLILLYRFWSRRKLLPPAQRYLLSVSFMAFLFYSISVTPTMYAPFMYFIMTVFAYVALSANDLTKWINTEY